MSLCITCQEYGFLQNIYLLFVHLFILEMHDIFTGRMSDREKDPPSSSSLPILTHHHENHI